MKKYVYFVILAVSSGLLFSCSKDDDTVDAITDALIATTTTSSTLQGTKWRCSDSEELSVKYMDFRFDSDTTVQVFTKIVGESETQQVSKSTKVVYVANDKTVSLTLVDQDGEVTNLKGTIDGTVLTVSDESGQKSVFNKYETAPAEEAVVLNGSNWRCTNTQNPMIESIDLNFKSATDVVRVGKASGLDYSETTNGKYIVEGNQFRAEEAGESGIIYSYGKVSGNTLTVSREGVTYVFTKKVDVVLNGTTWRCTDTRNANAEYFEFRFTSVSDAKFYAKVVGMSDLQEDGGTRTYTVSGNNVSITESYPSGRVEVLPATVSGNTMTVVKGGQNFVFTKQ